MRLVKGVPLIRYRMIGEDAVPIAQREVMALVRDDGSVSVLVEPEDVEVFWG